MIGSPGLAAWIAHVAFWVLMVWGWAAAELRTKGLVIFLLLWLAGFVGLPYVPNGAALFSSYVALLDVVLVLEIFKRGSADHVILSTRSRRWSRPSPAEGCR